MRHALGLAVFLSLFTLSATGRDATPEAKLGPPQVGEVLDAQDSGGGWYKATVIKIDGDRRFIHYEGYSDSWNEWLGPDRVRRRPVTYEDKPAPGRITTPTELLYPTVLGTPVVGEVLVARDHTAKWYNSTVLAVDGTLRFVHFHGWGDQFNEWVGPDSVRALTPAEATAASTKRTLDGWFAKTELVFFGGAHIRSTPYWFRPDGAVYFGNPPAGLGAADFAAVLKSDPNHCGTYQITGERLLLVKAGAAPEEHTYSPGAGGVMDASPLSRIYRFRDGARLGGTWETSTSSTFGGVHAVSASTWIFRPDGTFELRSYGGVETTKTKGTDGAAPGQAVGHTETIESGTSEFSGTLLKVRAPDGRTEVHTAFGVSSEESPRILTIDGMDLNQHE